MTLWELSLLFLYLENRVFLASRTNRVCGRASHDHHFTGDYYRFVCSPQPINMKIKKNENESTPVVEYSTNDGVREITRESVSRNQTGQGGDSPKTNWSKIQIWYGSSVLPNLYPQDVDCCGTIVFMFCKDGIKKEWRIQVAGFKRVTDNQPNWKWSVKKVACIRTEW